MRDLRDPAAVSADSANIARHLPLMAARQPGRPAVKVPRGRTRAGDIDYLTLTFAELDAEVDAWGARLAARGVRSGDRALVMVRPGLPLIAAAFALFKLGVVPVVIDPGMGLRNFLACVARSRPRVLLGIPRAQLASRIFRPAFRTIEVRITASSSMTARLGSETGNGDRMLRSPPCPVSSTTAPPTLRRCFSPAVPPARRRAYATPTACLTPRCASSATPTASSPAKSTCRCCRFLPCSTPPSA